MATGGRPDHPAFAGWVDAQRAVEDSQRTPLSARHALYAAVLIDRLAELAFSQGVAVALPQPAGSDDILAFRAAVQASETAISHLADLTACGMSGPRLQVVATLVPPDDFARLPVSDLMVSLYNAGTVPKLMLVQPDGAQLPMLDLLQTALDWWRTALERH